LAQQAAVTHRSNPKRGLQAGEANQCKACWQEHKQQTTKPEGRRWTELKQQRDPLHERRRSYALVTAQQLVPPRIPHKPADHQSTRSRVPMRRTNARNTPLPAKLRKLTKPNTRDHGADAKQLHESACHAQNQTNTMRSRPRCLTSWHLTTSACASKTGDRVGPQTAKTHPSPVSKVAHSDHGPRASLRARHEDDASVQPD
jgi:hypothetical protein